ncbi:MAG: hypothetical protein OEU32_13695, partial [Acidimicrobiia bacterium]|nr:hypothetical protein [Acidimicrobiia bacterium]
MIRALVLHMRGFLSYRVALAVVMSLAVTASVTVPLADQALDARRDDTGGDEEVASPFPDAVPGQGDIASGDGAGDPGDGGDEEIASDPLTEDETEDETDDETTDDGGPTPGPTVTPVIPIPVVPAPPSSTPPTAAPTPTPLPQVTP